MGSLKTTELVYLNEAAKALKQKNLILWQDNITHRVCAMAYDNIDSYINMTTLDVSMFYCTELFGYVVNRTEISAFVKSIAVEHEFELHRHPEGLCINSMTSTLVFRKGNALIAQRASAKAYSIDNCPILEAEELVNDKIANVLALRMNDGAVYYWHHDKYFMTLFAGIINTTKTDKVFLSIHSDPDIATNMMSGFYNSFYAAFRVVKKKFEIKIYIKYLMV